MFLLLFRGCLFWAFFIVYCIVFSSFIHFKSFSLNFCGFGLDCFKRNLCARLSLDALGLGLLALLVSVLGREVDAVLCLLLDVLEVLETLCVLVLDGLEEVVFNPLEELFHVDCRNLLQELLLLLLGFLLVFLLLLLVETLEHLLHGIQVFRREFFGPLAHELVDLLVVVLFVQV